MWGRGAAGAGLEKLQERPQVTGCTAQRQGGGSVHGVE